MSSYNYEERYKYPISIMLNITDDCNLKCRYCFVQQNPHYMTLNTAKKIVNWIYENFQKQKELKILEENNSPSLYFFGGEPMLCYDNIIYPIVNYCNEKYPNIFRFGITTNGTLLNKEKIDFFKENNFRILLSMDGAKETQDYNRPCKNCNLSSFNLLEKNISYLLEKFPNVCFRSTIYAPTVEHLFENYLYAESLGFSHYTIIEDMRHDNLWTEERLNILEEQFGKIYAYRLQQILEDKPIMQFARISKWMKKSIDILNNKEDFLNLTINRCGLGTTGCSIGYNGNIYGCQEQDSKNEETLFFIGNVFNGGVNLERHNRLLTFYYNEYANEKKVRKNECKTCSLDPICDANYQMCPSTNYDLYKNIMTINNINCKIRKIYYENSILTLLILSELKSPKEVEQILKKYFSDEKI